MQGTTGLAIAGTVANALVALAALASGEYPPVFCGVMLAFVAVSLLGLILVAAGSRRLGAGMVIAGSVPFVPIGIIGALGGRKILDAANREAFEAGRAR